LRSCAAATTAAFGTVPGLGRGDRRLADVDAGERAVDVTMYSLSLWNCIDRAEPQVVSSFHRRVPAASKQ
jgi:hypothetical protein